MSDNQTCGSPAFEEGDFVDKVTLRQVSLRIFRFPLASIIPSVLLVHISVIDCRRSMTFVSTNFILKKRVCLSRKTGRMVPECIMGV